MRANPLPCIRQQGKNECNLLRAALRLTELVLTSQSMINKDIPSTKEHLSRAWVYALLARTSVPVGPFLSSAAQGGTPGT